MSKTDILKHAVCLQFCSYYKPGGNEELSCGGYERIDRFLQECRQVIVAPSGSRCTAAQADGIVVAVCSPCSFRVDGCDFILDRKAPPCGGFLLLSQLIADGTLQIEELER